MAHNPIHSQQTLPRFSLGSRLEVPSAMVGIIFHKGVFVHQLRPGDESRRFPGHTFYLVDVAPHSVCLSVSAQDRTMVYHFPLQVFVSYRVQDAKRMVSESISDTERIVQDGIEPLIHQESRKFPLYDYIKLSSRLETVINDMAEKLFTERGLLLLQPCQVKVRTDDSFLAQVRQSRDYWQAHTAPQSASHKLLLPSKEAIRQFDANVTVNYRVVSSADLPKGDHALAESQLWPQLERRLSEKTREYSVEEVHSAQVNANSLISANSVVGFGITIESVNVRLEMDTKSREEWEQQEAESGRRDRELLEQDHKIALMQRMSDFIEKYYREEDLELLRLAKDIEKLDESADKQELLKQQRTLKEMEAQNLQLELLREIVSSDTYQDKREELMELLFKSLKQSLPGKAKELPVTKTKELKSGEPSDSPAAPREDTGAGPTEDQES
jgi:hypothetical protein